MRFLMTVRPSHKLENQEPEEKRITSRIVNFREEKFENCRCRCCYVPGNSIALEKKLASLLGYG